MLSKIEELERRIELKKQTLAMNYFIMQEEIILLVARLEDEKKAGIKWRAEERTR